MKKHNSNATFIGILDKSSHINIIKSISSLSAGIPSHNDDNYETMDLNELCISHPDATILYQAGGDSMTLAGIYDKDYLIIDSSLEVREGQIIACTYCGGSLVKQYHKDDTGITLIAHSDEHDNVVIKYPEYFSVIGVVTWVFSDKRKFR